MIRDSCYREEKQYYQYIVYKPRHFALKKYLCKMWTPTAPIYLMHIVYVEDGYSYHARWWLIMSCVCNNDDISILLHSLILQYCIIRSITVIMTLECFDIWAFGKDNLVNDEHVINGNKNTQTTELFTLWSTSTLNTWWQLQQLYQFCF